MPKREIEITGSQFERRPADAKPSSAPDPFEDILSMNITALRELGCQAWDGPDENGYVLMLFPGEWFSFIPAGFKLTSIMGREVTFNSSEESDDIRHGCLAYGIRVKD